MCGVADAAAGRGWGAVAVTTSPLPGPSGNVEFFLLLRRGITTLDRAAIEAEVERGSAAALAGERVEP